jgi:hypothetical protein
LATWGTYEGKIVATGKDRVTRTFSIPPEISEALDSFAATQRVRGALPDSDGAKNKIFTRARYEAALAHLRASNPQLAQKVADEVVELGIFLVLAIPTDKRIKLVELMDSRSQLRKEPK